MSREPDTVTRYRVVEEATIEELQETVNDLLERGWELQGGVCIKENQYGGLLCLYQALVRTRDRQG